jgi:trimeric autotransporter adhesin
MPNYNLTTQQIKDTYEQLVQVSGSAIVDGTGSLVNAFDYPSNSTFTSFSSSVAAEIAPLVASSGSAEWNLISGIPAGLVSSSAQTISNLSGTDIISSSAQIATDISGAFTSTSASLAAGIATNTSNISTQTSRVDSLVSATSSYAVKAENNSFSGLQTFNNIAVNGTASVAYLQSVTGSAKIIGDAFIILNADTPTQRYAGVKVYDSGSSPISTGSFQWDSENNDWFYEYEKDDTDYAVALFGPEFATKGTPTYPTTNTIQKGTGGHHLTGSNITDNGTTVTISTPLSSSAMKLTSGGLTFADGTTQTTKALGGLVSGTGTDSMKSSDTLTTNPATASGDRSIAIGNGASATANDGINIGDKFKYDGSNTIQLNSNGLLFNSTGTLGASSTGINLGIEGGSITGNYSSNFGCTYGTISTGDSTLVGGYNNTISAGTVNLIIGGEANQITNGNYSQIFGGASNTISAGDTSFIVGGYQNQVTNGIRNGVIGGNQAISAHDFSVVIGRQSYTTTAAYTTYVASLDVSGSTSIVNGAGATGSLVDNIHPTIASSSAQIEHIVTITQGQYTSLSASSGVSDDTLYIISDAGDNVYPGNLQVNGQINSPVFAGTIASSTSSIDFDNGNFATLNCATSTFLANPTNLKSGTTYTLIITNGANISGYGTDWKFAGAAAPTFSANTDILTAVSDGTNLYATGLADFS